MLGWQIFINDQSGASLATWVVGLGGLSWLDVLVEQGLAEQLQAGGYPTAYKVAAEHVLPQLRANQLPSHHGPIVLGDDYVDLGGQNTNIKLNQAAISACHDDDVLLVEAWDQS